MGKIVQGGALSPLLPVTESQHVSTLQKYPNWHFRPFTELSQFKTPKIVYGHTVVNNAKSKSATSRVLNSPMNRAGFTYYFPMVNKNLNVNT